MNMRTTGNKDQLVSPTDNPEQISRKDNKKRDMAQQGQQQQGRQPDQLDQQPDDNNNGHNMPNRKDNNGHNMPSRKDKELYVPDMDNTLLSEAVKSSIKVDDGVLIQYPRLKKYFE